MPLISTIDEIQQFVRITFPTGNGRLPNMAKTERKFLVPLIGKEIYNNLQEEYDNDNLGEGNKALLSYVQAALAPLAYWMELPFIHTQITDAGLVKMISADTQPVFKYDYNKALASLLESGMDALEELLLFLEENKEQYPLWTESKEYIKHRSYFIKNATEYNEIFALQRPRCAFIALQPAMRIVEDFYIEKTIGTSFSNSLREIITPSEAESQAICLIRKAIAYLTIKHAISTLSVKLTDSGFTVQVSDPDSADASRQSATNNDLAKLNSECEHIGNSYLLELRNFLNSKASGSIFPLYFNSDRYQSPNQQEAPGINSKLKSSFFL